MDPSVNSMKLEVLPKGYRFRPTDEELVSHYLRLKINCRHSEVDVIPEVDVCKWEPWDLPALSVIKSDDPEWFFFCPRDKKYPNGHRSNRATEAGYWKATGKDRAIKSRKGHSGSHLIGMKKTLVFHRGRAPKGERMNWIMHEYRATEPDLDGTGPEQGDYVLCRLFHKAEEKLDHAKYDQVDHTGLFPSTDKSYPDDVSPGLFREPAMRDTQILKEQAEVKKWLTFEADCMAPTINPVPIGSSASDGVDLSGEETAMEVYGPLRDISIFEEATYNLFEDKVLDSLLSHSHSDLVACIGSPFADDFGSEQNGLNFQDGASEQDASLSELLEGLENHDNYFGEESTSPRTNFVTREIPNAGYVNGPEQTPLKIFEARECKLHEETDNRMVQPQGQISPSVFQVMPSGDHSHSCCPVEEVDSSANIARGSWYGPVETFYHTLKDDNTTVSETGIQIQSRQPRNQLRSTTQGSAPRRIRLWLMGCGPRSVCGKSSKDEEHESHSLIMQVIEDTDRASECQESEDQILSENEECTKKCSSRVAMKHGQNGSGKMRAFILSEQVSAGQGSNYLKGCAVGIHIVMILLVVFLGMWIFPRSPFASLCIIDM